MTDAAIHLIFEPWHPNTPGAQPVVGTWSRTAWLPTLGPSSWLLWTDLFAQVANGPATITDRDLAERVGISHRRIHSPLDRLTQFRILNELGQDYYAVRTNAGPLSTASLAKRPPDVAHLQANLFGLEDVTAPRLRLL